MTFQRKKIGFVWPIRGMNIKFPMMNNRPNKKYFYTLIGFANIILFI